MPEASPTRPRPRSLRGLATVLLAVAASTFIGCATNPATGQNQLSFFSEAEEIQLGIEVDREFLSNSGTYPDPELEAYVADLGRRLAAVSERPDLPWSFRIADDEIVNAFALPGGRIYVTRGLLAHLNREAELVGVLGHEIGHVTARHSVHGMSRDLAITLGVVAGLELLDVGEASEMVASMGLGLLFLKFGRNQERQADQLGVRYAQRADFDPHGVVDALRVLRNVSHAQSDGWMPVWLSTHPDPDQRWQRLAEETGLGAGPPPGSLDREVNEYLARLDGLVYGADPRNGMLRDSSYIQRRNGFRMDFPGGWKIEREGQTVAAENSAADAMVMLLPQMGGTVGEAAEAFAAEDWVRVTRTWNETFGVLPARLAQFDADLEDEQVRGIVAFVQTRGPVVAVLGVSSAEAWPSRRSDLESSVRSIGPVDDRQGRWPEPSRLAIVTLGRAMSARDIARQYSPDVEPETIALLNQVEIDQPIPAGRRVKVVRAAR